MKTAYSINKYMKILFYTLTAVILIGFFWAQSFYPSENEYSAVPDELTYEGTVLWEKPDGSTEQIAVPGKYEVSPGQVMTILSILPRDFQENTIGIRGSQQTVRFYIDGELRYEYDTKDSRPFGSNSASRYVFCPTSAEDAGKELRIELASNSGRYSGVVNEIYCAEKSDIWSYLFSLYGGEAITALFILFCGIVAIVFSVALSIIYKATINLNYWGWCMVFGAIWLLAQSNLRQLFFPNTSALASLCFVVIMLCPVPILFYVDSVQHGQYRRLYSVIEGIAVLNLVISSILQIAEVADFLDTLFVAHIIMGSAFIAVFITFFLDYRKGRIREYLLIVIGVLIGMLAAGIEAVSVYFVTYASGVFLGIGLLVVLFFTIINTAREIRNMESKRQQEEIFRRKKQTEAMSLQMIQTLSTTIEAKDEYTKGHSYRVAEYSALIAKELGWNDNEVQNLRNAARLHDIGKIGIPDTILNKPTRLLDTEYEIIKKHTSIGADILKNITLIDHIEEVARYHHERYDGRGYPEGLGGEAIPIHARIVAVADSYDAMNSKRIYRNPLPKDMIRREILRNKGIQFDPVVADVFLKLFDENRMQVDETNQNFLPEEAFSEFDTSGPMEAGKFISDLMNTMRYQRDAENIDYLTGLPLRNCGERQIAERMQVQNGCLAFLDMDNLKKINDIYGHRAGDKALKLLGDTITTYAKDAISCRLGGDEFLLFLPDVTKEEASDLTGSILDSFQAKKDADVEIRSASLSGGLCMCLKGDNFEECYAKADKALYSIKQTGKNGYAFFHQLKQQDEIHKTIGKDLEQVAKALRESGSYSGALGLDNREFAKIYEYMSNLGERYKHSCHLVLITLDAVSDSTMFIEKIEQALDCMEVSIRRNIRNVDICTRYSSMQYLVILMEAGTDNIPLVIDRIFAQFYKLYNKSDFIPRYEFMAMLQSASASTQTESAR